MDIVPAWEGDVPIASKCLADAFEADPLMAFFFPGSAGERRLLVMEMLALLMSARIALGMPVLVLRQEDRIAGAAMGYDTRHLEWPALLSEQWALFEAKQSAMAERFQTFEHVSMMFRPTAPHYYLGVLGIQPSLQGRGAGAALLDAYCTISAQDKSSTGTFLQTGNSENINFYRRRGFELLGEGRLDGQTTLWCLFRPNSTG